MDFYDVFSKISTTESQVLELWGNQLCRKYSCKLFVRLVSRIVPISEPLCQRRRDFSCIQIHQTHKFDNDEINPDLFLHCDLWILKNINKKHKIIMISVELISKRFIYWVRFWNMKENIWTYQKLKLNAIVCLKNKNKFLTILP